MKANMKRLLICTSGFYGGGTEAALNAFLKHLDNKKYHVDICCLQKKGPFLKKVPPNITVRELSFTRPRYQYYVSTVKEKNDSVRIVLWKLSKKCFQLFHPIRKKQNTQYHFILKKVIENPMKYDIILDFHGYGYFLTAYSAMLSAEKKAMWIHDENIHWAPKVEEYFPAFDRFFCVSQAVRKAFLQQYPQYACKTEVFYNMIDIPDILEKAQEPLADNRYKGEFKILSVGRLEWQKGFDIAIQAAMILKKRHVNFRWYVLGEGNERANLEKQLRLNNLQEFILLGRTENPYPYIKACDLYVQPSRHEGYPIAVIEARALHKPILASNIPSIREQITDGVNGYLVELTREALADKIEELIANPILRNHAIAQLERETIDFSDEIKKFESL